MRKSYQTFFIAEKMEYVVIMNRPCPVKQFGMFKFVKCPDGRWYKIYNAIDRLLIVTRIKIFYFDRVRVAKAGFKPSTQRSLPRVCFPASHI